MSVLMPDHRERAIGGGEGWLKSRNGLYLPPAVLNPNPPIGIDLFAGAGGFSCGFHQAGWDVAAASEWWPVAAETYLCNLGAPSTGVYVGEKAAPDATKKERRIFEARGGELITAAELFELLPSPNPGPGPAGPGTSPYARELDYPCALFLLCDVHELTGDMILDLLGMEQGEVGCVFGGPPCQGFSRANGKRDPGDGRNQLVFEFARLVCEIKPQSLCMENVPGIVDMVTPEGIPVIDALSMILESGGMGEYEALRRSLLSTAGLGAAVKGAKKPTRRPKPDTGDDVVDVEVEDAEQQLALELE